MTLDQIFEDAHFDINMRSHVANMCYKAMHKMYHGEQPYAELNIGDDRFMCFLPTQLGLNKVLPNTLFLLGLKKSRLAAIKTTAQSTAFADTFQHELTHAVDDNRTSGKMIDKPLPLNLDSDSGSRSYYNDNAEYNAYFHDIASNLSGIARDLSNVTTCEDAQELLDLYGFIGDFKNDLVQLMQANRLSSKMFLKWLSAENRKKLLRRLYVLHAEIMRRISALPSKAS